jgi:alpha-tubulin suppressor-like RCC1 family protein
LNPKAMKILTAAGILMLPFLLVSCGGTSTTVVTYTLGGTVSGLSGTGLVLQDSGSNNLSVSAGSTTFTFNTAVASGSSYSVTILTQPSSPAQTCTVTDGAGTANANIGNVQIYCVANTFTVGVTVSGLSGTGLVLQDNGGNNTAVNANGSYTFTTVINRGGTYNVTVLTQPSGPSQTCGVTNGFGTATIANVTGIQVNCVTTTVTYTIGVTVSGLSGTGLVLENNTGDNLSVSTNGNFTFATAIASGSSYSVTVLTQPSNPAETCVVAAGIGIANSNITGILVTCTENPFSITGTVSGLSGAGLLLQDNGGNSLSISPGATTFAFSKQLAVGSSYAVIVENQPTGQNCTVANGSGTVASANVTNIAVTCSGSAFNVGVTVSGLLPNTSVVLQDNGSDTLSISTNGIPADFNLPVTGGSAYGVTVLAQPVGATCMVGSNGSGRVASTNINISITCGAIIAAGQFHTCAVTSSGAVLCWGSNQFGQLGNGNTTNSSAPVPVTGLSSGVVSIAAGQSHTCALTNTGYVWCWGDNASGQLGNGTLFQSGFPVQVLDPTGHVPLSGVISIASGQSHTCAATNLGAALCWGDNSEGELGNGTNSQSNLSVSVSGLSSGVAAISAGSNFTCALTTTGGVSCWGEGGSGQLGNGSAINSATPVAVLNSTGSAPLAGVLAINSGFENTCAVVSSQAVLCWGANNSDQLGNGTNSTTTPQSNIPVNVLSSAGQSALTGVIAITGGLDDNCALTSSGAALCWGANGSGELGNGGNSNAATPVPVTGLSKGVVAIAAGQSHTCSVTSAGEALCWGSDVEGQLGNGTNNPSSIPVEVVGETAGFLQLF